MFQYTTAQSEEEIQQILQLQLANLPKNISATEAKMQGFVTVHHSPEILHAMNVPYPHIIAKVKERVVGYTLVMLRKFKDEVPVLKPMFQKIDGLSFHKKPLLNTKYFVMGQVCVDKNFRGQGVFNGLYQQMRKEMSPFFDCIITEIATRNTRSMRAHHKVGFEIISVYSTEQEEWAIVGWNFENKLQSKL